MVSLNYIAAHLIRLGLIYLCISMTNSSLSKQYIENVILNDKEPPSLTGSIGWSLLYDVIANVLMIIVLVVALGTDPQTIISIVIEYICILVAFGIISFYIASTMQNRKYFLYKDDGLRAIRSFKKIIVIVALVIYIIPFGLMLPSSS